MDGCIEVGRVAALSLYPVKSLRGTGVDSATVRPWGFEGDRLWAVIDSSGRVLTQRVLPQMARIDVDLVPGGLRLRADGAVPLVVGVPAADAEPVAVRIWSDDVVAADAGAAAGRWLSERLGTPARLVHLGRPETARPVDPDYARAGDMVSLADGYPMLVCTTASLADLNRHLAPDMIGMDRFRTNIVVETDVPWDEERWTRIVCGAVTFDAVKPCTRCTVITIDQMEGRRGRGADPLTTLLALRRDPRGRPIFGRNLIPRAPGVLRVGDRVWAEEAVLAPA